MPEKDTSETQVRSNTIRLIETELQFLVLIVLVAEAGLLTFVATAEGIGRNTGIVGMIVVILVSIAVLPFLDLRRKNQNNRFGRRIEGAWWQRIYHSQGSALSFVSIVLYKSTGDVLLQGTSYGTDGKPSATWHSEMARLYPDDRRISFLWRGKKPLPDSARHDFHGYGNLEFKIAEGDSAILVQGSGTFWDVDQTDPSNTVVKSFELQRIVAEDEEDKKIMEAKSSLKKRDVILKVLERW